MIQLGQGKTQDCFLGRLHDVRGNIWSKDIKYTFNIWMHTILHTEHSKCLIWMIVLELDQAVEELFRLVNFEN